MRVRRVFIYIIGLLVLAFCIPVVFVNLISENVVEDNEVVRSIPVVEKYDYGKYTTIKLLHSKTNEVVEMPLDEYICGVVSAEMPADFELEALKAQAIVARTYTFYKIINNDNKHNEAQICDNPACCQAWISKEDRLERWEPEKREDNWEKIVNSVNATKGKIITYNGSPINAFFHSNSGGTTESPINVWGGSNYPYLQSVTTSGEEAYSQYNSELEITKDEFINKIKGKYSDFDIDFNNENCIEVKEYTTGGRIKNIKIGNREFSGVEIRTIFGLKSANFNIELHENTIKFTVVGYGHGVGMSQTGADSLAKQGYSCDEIINHFYIGVTIQEE